MKVVRMIDLKHGITDDGRLVKVLSDGELAQIPENEPLILFRGRDKLALPMLRYYRSLCLEDGVTDYQKHAIEEMINRFGIYADENITKQPGITRGAKWDGEPS